MRVNLRVLCIGLMAMLLASCSYKAKNTLLKSEKKVKLGKQAVVVEHATTDTAIYQHRIKSDDRIVVTFLNSYDLEKQNLGNSSADEKEQKGFLVNEEGKVTLPIIGTVELGGLTRFEAARKLEGLYSKYIQNPIIDVSIINLSVSVLGEVRTPGTYQLDKENTTLLEVLAMAGGVTDNGKLKGVKIIRGNRSNPEVIYVDLTQLSSIGNSKIIIHDRDIVYVEPMGTKLVGTPITGISPYFLILSSLASIIIAISILAK